MSENLHTNGLTRRSKRHLQSPIFDRPRSKLALQVPEPKSDPSTAILQSYLKNRELQFKHRTSASNRLYCARCRTAARARVPVWSQVAPELADCWRAAWRCWKLATGAKRSFSNGGGKPAHRAQP